MIKVIKNKSHIDIFHLIWECDVCKKSWRLTSNELMKKDSGFCPYCGTIRESYLPRIIEWSEYGWPTKNSIERLSSILKSKDYKQVIMAIYSALSENYYPDYCGPERVEVRGEIIDVWGYHTGGWSGNERIISVLSKSFIFHWLLERYDSGGHYYFKPIGRVLSQFNTREVEEDERKWLRKLEMSK